MFVFLFLFVSFVSCSFCFGIVCLLACSVGCFLDPSQTNLNVDLKSVLLVVFVCFDAFLSLVIVFVYFILFCCVRVVFDVFFFLFFEFLVSLLIECLTSLILFLFF